MSVSVNSFVPSTQNIHPQSVSTKIFNYGYYPLLKGNIAPTFPLNDESFVTMQHFLDMLQPLVVVFYSKVENDNYILQSLTKLQSQVQQSGGNLLVLTSKVSKAFKKKAAQFSSLNIFVDSDNEIAELFGLFDSENPLQNWLSGIDEDGIGLPALYVIAPDRKIVFHHIDYQFELFKQPSIVKNITENLLEAVDRTYESYTYLNISYNKLVS